MLFDDTIPQTNAYANFINTLYIIHNVCRKCFKVIKIYILKNHIIFLNTLDKSILYWTSFSFILNTFLFNNEKRLKIKLALQHTHARTLRCLLLINSHLAISSNVESTKWLSRRMENCQIDPKDLFRFVYFGRTKIAHR